MRRSIVKSQIIGFVVTAVVGTVLHFLYEWFGEAVWIAPFSGVNESTWEHMKLLFWPTFIFAIAQSFALKDREDFWSIKLRGILLGQIFIPVIFYTYNGAIGRSPDWLNISIFFVCAAISYIYESRRFNEPPIPQKRPMLPFFILCAIAIIFVIFTFITPKLGIFKDPLSGEYGI